jgi:hypothetical protein
MSRSADATVESDDGHADNGESGRAHERRIYLRFGAMIATSTVVMFLLTYTNVFAFTHLRFSEERV